jgi:Leucine-rich repeat (LRR) protein
MNIYGYLSSSFRFIKNQLCELCSETFHKFSRNSRTDLLARSVWSGATHSSSGIDPSRLSTAPVPRSDFESDLQKWVDEKQGTNEYDNRQKAQKRMLNCYRGQGTSLDLRSLQLSSLPRCIGKLTDLRALDLGVNQLSTLPAEICNLTSLEKLYLSENQLSTLPAEIGNLTNLRELDLRANQLSTLPAEIGNLTSLEKLYLSENQLSTLPAEIGRLTSLENLNLSLNRLIALPAEIGNLTNLRELDLRANQLSTLPAEIGNLTNLQELSLHNNQLSALPAEIGNLTNLRELSLHNNQLSTLPAEIGNLTNLKKLDLVSNQLSTLPVEIGNLTSLENLELSWNQLSTLPAEIDNLTNLRELALDRNQLSTLPAGIGNLTNLRELSLHNNQLSTLPAGIGNLTSLENLELSWNQLSTLPAEIVNLTRLGRLTLHNNRIATLSNAVFTYLQQRSPLLLNGNPIFQNFHSQDAAAAGADLKEQLQKWLDVSSDADLPSIYKELLSHPSKDFLALLLARLGNLQYIPADYRERPEALKVRIQSILKKGCESKEAMDILCTRAQSATESCGDAIAYELDNLELALDLLQMDKLDDPSLAKFLLKFHRKKRLDEYVREFLKKNPHREEIETALFFHTKLQDLLPSTATSMRYRGEARISESEAPGKIEEAKEFITKDCQTVEEQAKVLCGMDPWNERIENRKDYSDFMKTMYDKLGEQEKEEKTDQEHVASGKSLLEAIGQWKLNLTKNVLKQIS